MNTKQKIIGFLLAVVALLGGGYTAVNLGSVSQSSEYHATSTNTQALFANYSVIRGTSIDNGATSSPTVLGSILILTVGTSPMCFHDATSTATNAECATSTIACFGASAAVGTYGPWDVQYQKGILVEFTGSPTATSRASSTITFR